MDSEIDRLRERIVLLEENAAHQNHIVDELSGQLAEQWTIIDHLQMKLDRLSEQFRALEDATLEAPAITRPPHY